MTSVYRFFALALLPALLGGWANLATAQCTEIFFSEYIEGSSNNKALELYNPTDSPIDLSNYAIQRYNNGATTANDTLNLTGILLPHRVYSIANPLADTALTNNADTLHSITFFNGDDALVLLNAALDTVDKIGVVGLDPGTSWPVGTGATREFTLVRNLNIQGGQDDWAVGATQWTPYPQDFFGLFATHSATPCTPTGNVGCNSAELFISEYIEGPFNDKAIEIYNGTGSSVSMTNYELHLFSNGATTASSTLALTGTLPDGDVYLAAHPLAAFAGSADITDGVTINFNGNDAVALINTATNDTLDIIGVIGQNPGGSWPVGLNGTQNSTLVREPAVLEGTTNWAQSSTEWIGFTNTNGNQMNDSLGAHTVTCPFVEFAATLLSAPESAGIINVEVNISTAPSTDVVVPVFHMPQPSTAVQGLDFLYPVPDTVVFPAGSTTPQTITFVLQDDNVYEGADGDTIYFQLLTANPLTVGQFNTLKFVITDDETAPVLSFANPAPSVNENAANPAELQVQSDVASAFPLQVEVALVPGSGTATPGTDFSFTGPQTLTLPAYQSLTTTGAPVDPLDDMQLEGNETAVFRLQNPTQNATLAANDSTLLTITDDEQPVPLYDIATVTTYDVNGEPDSLGVVCELRGVVQSPNYRPNGLEFFLHDGTGGIAVFRFDSIAGYSLSQGDSLSVFGEIDQFNGLTQLALDSLTLHQQGQPLQAPTPVFTLDETTESEVVALQGMSLVDPAQWQPTGNGFNVQITNGTDTLTMRIDADIDLFSLPLPPPEFTVTGMGSQFDNSSLPLDSNYQVLPRYSQDIRFGTSITPTLLCDSTQLSILYTGTGAQWTTGQTDSLITVTNEATYGVTVTYGNAQAQDSLLADIFSYQAGFALTTDTGCVDTPFAFSLQTSGPGIYTWDFGDGNQSTQAAPLHPYTTPGDYSVNVTVNDPNNICTVTLDTTINITDCSVGFAELLQAGVRVYPNPVRNGRLHLTWPAGNALQGLSLHTLQGRRVWQQPGTPSNGQLQLQLPPLPAGLYLLRFRLADQPLQLKLLVH